MSKSRWQPYPAYRDSKVCWIGKIPAHWEARRLKHAAAEVGVKVSEKPESVPYLGLENIESGTGRLLLGEPADEVESTVVAFQEGDVLFGKLRPYLAKVVHADFKGVGTTELLVLRPAGETDGRFLFYHLLTSGFIDTVNSLTYGTKMPRANSEQVRNLLVALPPLPEQRAIAAFLDRETARIDALVAKQERLIALLLEKRAALISHAVTKGLDPDVVMKDSGTPWLGEIPAHWELVRLKFLTKKPLQYGANEAAQINDPDLPRYIRITDISEDGSLRENTFRSLPFEAAADYLLEPGDLLLARSGATVGKSFMYQESWGTACYAGYLIRFRPDLTVVEPRFILYFVNSPAYWNWLSSTFIQATIQNVSAEKYANLLVSVPPLVEQRAITAHLDRETAKTDALVAKAQEIIGRLQEYRTALISAAVTGRIDVR